MQNYLYLQHPLWTAIFVGSFLAFFFVASWAGQRERNMAQGENRDRGSRVVIYLLSFLGLALAFGLASAVPSARIALPPEPVFAVAIVTFWSGLLLYVWSVKTLGQSFRTSVTLLEGQQLVRRGPYRVLRHPAYSGGILIFAGIGLAIGNWLSFAAAVLTVTAAYVWRIHVEERALSERFGAEFEADRKRTWAVIPFVW